MNVLEAIHTKRAVREFNEQPVPEEVIMQILDSGRLAQSSKNEQPWTFILIQERRTLQELSTCGKYAGHIAGAAFAVAMISSVDWAFDIGQAAAYLQLAAWELGVSSCIASMWEEDRARDILGVPDDMRFEIAISFGYASRPTLAAPRKSGRRTLKEIVRVEHW